MRCDWQSSTAAAAARDDVILLLSCCYHTFLGDIAYKRRLVVDSNLQSTCNSLIYTPFSVTQTL